MSESKKIKQRNTPKEDELLELAYDYVLFCENHTKEVTTSREIVEIKERHLPTISYFLNIYLPLHSKVKNTIERSWYYRIKGNDKHPLSNTIKKIDELFRALATDIVANEGKGIFYAKNFLNMRDVPKDEEPQQHEIQFKFGNE